MKFPGLKVARPCARIVFLLFAALISANAPPARAEITAREGAPGPKVIHASCGDCAGIAGRMDSITGSPLTGFTTGMPGLEPRRALLDAVGDLGFGPDGHLYLLVSFGFGFNSALLRYDPATRVFHQVAASPGLQGEVRTALRLGADGNTYLSGSVNGVNGLIRIRDLATGMPLSSAPSVTFGPDHRGALDSLGAGADGLLDLPYKDVFFRFDREARLWLTPVSTAPAGPAMKNWTFALGPDGALYAEFRGESGVFRFDAETGEFLGRFDLDEAAASNIGVASRGAVAIPEPATFLLLAAGWTGLLFRRSHDARSAWHRRHACPPTPVG
ncbi:MAG: hypothetical protein Q8R92_15990 [Deltaproteobacteria bacterium]|nr:hypothetical protein [Deltaproteobacteria bacterium]